MKENKRIPFSFWIIWRSIFGLTWFEIWFYGSFQMVQSMRWNSKYFHTSKTSKVDQVPSRRFWRESLTMRPGKGSTTKPLCWLLLLLLCGTSSFSFYFTDSFKCYKCGVQSHDKRQNLWKSKISNLNEIWSITSAMHSMLNEEHRTDPNDEFQV